MALTADKRAMTSGRFGLMLDGSNTGWLMSAEGGHATADVVEEKSNHSFIRHKHLGPIKYEDISITCGTGMSKNFYNWLDASVQGKTQQGGRKDGAVLAADYDYNVITSLNFHQAMLTELGFPALDASAKDACKLSVKFTPEYTRFEKGSGKLKSEAKSPIQKKWLPCNFRVKIDGLDEACTKVNKVEALTVKQKLAVDAQGDSRDYQQVPAHLEFPNLVITLAESHAESVYKWHDDFVIKGNCFDSNEKGGTIEYLTTDLKTVLFTLTFSNLGIFKLTADKVEPGGEQVRRLKVEMYCEQIKFAYGGDATWY